MEYKRLFIGFHLFVCLLVFGISALGNSVNSVNHIFLIIFLIIIPLKHTDHINLFYFDIYLIISISVFYFFWLYPLIELNSVRTSYQDSRLTDSNFYEYVASQISINPIENYNRINATWLSQGVISYGSIIFYLFGNNYFTITIFNSILILFSIKNLQSLKFENKIPKWFFWLCFISPYSLLMNSVLSKEILSVFGMTLFLVGLIKNDGFLKFKSFIILLINRVQIFVFSFFFIVKKNKIALVFFTILFLIIYNFENVFSANNYLSLERIYEVNINRMISKSADDSSYFKELVFNIVGPTSLFKIIFFAPIRLIIWFVSPFPLIDLLSIFENEKNNFVSFKNGINFLRQISSIINFIIIPFLIFFYNNNRISKTFILYNVYIMIFVSTLAFLEGARYRVIFIPFLLISLFPILFDSKAKKLFILFGSIILTFVLFIQIIKYTGF